MIIEYCTIVRVEDKEIRNTYILMEYVGVQGTGNLNSNTVPFFYYSYFLHEG